LETLALETAALNARNSLNVPDATEESHGAPDRRYCP
jgi:hypothetical protein